ncbi:MAG: ATP-binding cassette domain-containing protein, partial [Methylobacteriaceae bacterium]|nr:ATP-binding cassette domain-containing protein [Methylobacteriaceae bacterium]
MLSVQSIDLFYGAAQSLRGVSLQASPGRVTCVMGRNGVGKSSLLRAIVGHQAIAGGRIIWDDQEISTLAPHERARRGIGYVPQGREIFPLLTVRENLETGCAPVARGERFVPEDVLRLFPVLAEMMGRRGGDLSGGQQQQLAIGRA